VKNFAEVDGGSWDEFRSRQPDHDLILPGCDVERNRPRLPLQLTGSRQQPEQGAPGNSLWQDRPFFAISR
jgi:hypothetical protein